MMAEKPNDRPKTKIDKKDESEPKIYIIVDGQKFPRPGLETFFAEPEEGQTERDRQGCSCHPVVGAYCSCNKVCTCVPVCSCVGHSSSSTRGGYGCRCAPVH